MTEIIITLLVIALVVGLYYYNQYRKKQSKAKKAEESKASYLAMAKKVHDLLYPINVALEDGKEVPLGELEKLASNPQSRFFLYEALRSHGQSNLFPKKYFNHQASAESQLVHYLSHVHALGTQPKEIIFVEKRPVAESGNTFDYYVFKFTSDPSHPAAKKGWMQGVVGPYAQNSSPYCRALATHSFIESIEVRSAQEHVEYAHANENPQLSNVEKQILQLA